MLKLDSMETKVISNSYIDLQNYLTVINKLKELFTRNQEQHLIKYIPHVQTSVILEKLNKDMQSMIDQYFFNNNIENHSLDIKSQVTAKMDELATTLLGTINGKVKLAIIDLANAISNEYIETHYQYDDFVRDYIAKFNNDTINLSEFSELFLYLDSLKLT